MEREFDNINRKVFLLIIFGIAMGLLESIVVIYIRHIYYPAGFQFPLANITSKMLLYEILREASTIIMLLTIASISGRNFMQKFAYFILSFAIWDIFYYVSLKLLIGWPSEFLTWDLLFLIPLPWIAPVLAPMICTIVMIIMAISILAPENRGERVKFTLWEWVFTFLGSFIILATFFQKYIKLLYHNVLAPKATIASQYQNFHNVLEKFQPVFFDWILFAVGIFILILTIIFYLKRYISY